MNANSPPMTIPSPLLFIQVMHICKGGQKFINQMKRGKKKASFLLITLTWAIYIFYTTVLLLDLFPAPRYINTFLLIHYCYYSNSTETCILFTLHKQT